MKYIDADRLREELQKSKTELKVGNYYLDNSEQAVGYENALIDFESLLDTLEEPEQPTRGYDEAYLNEKIAKASKSWKGVDVDKFMDEIRGREQPVTDCNDLEEAAEKYRFFDFGTPDEIAQTAFKAGAEWQKEQDEMSKVNYEGARAVYDNTVQHLQEKIDEKYELGKKDMKEQMMKEAIAYVAQPDVQAGNIQVPFIRIGRTALFRHGIKVGDKVRIIIVKEDGEWARSSARTASKGIATKI